MNKLTLLALIVTIFSLFGCDRQYKIAKIIPGKTKVQTAITYLNAPVESKTSTFDANSTFYKWKDVSLVVQNNIVTSLHREPASHEVYLQFWRQHYKNFKTDFKRVNNNSLWQLTIFDKNISVIYDENNDRVTRVIHYGK